MVGIVVVSHSAKLAEGVVELARQMGGGEVPLVATGGVDDPDDPIGTDAFSIKEAIEKVWSPDGVVVLMDLGSAVLNAETALDFLEPPVDPSKVVLCEAPLVEGAVAAVAASGIGATIDEVVAEARSGLEPKREHLGVGDERPATAPATIDGAVTREFTVSNALGLHLRPAGKLVETLGRFEAQAEIANLTTGSGPAPGRSLSRVSALGIRQGHVMSVTAAGPDAEALLSAVEQLVADRFGEREPEEPISAAGDMGEEEIAAEGRLVGIPAAPGLAVGPVRRLRRPKLEIEGHQVGSVEEERSRLEAGVAAAQRDIERQREAARRRVGAAEGEIFTAHLLILADEELLATARDAIGPEIGAAQAWKEAVTVAAARLRELDDPYQAARAADVEAVGDIVLAHILGVDPTPRLEEGGVLVADDLTPGETAALDTDLVTGIVTSGGAPTSHSAIIARALGVPAVVAVGPIAIEDGTVVLVDGNTGTVIIEPDPDLVREAEVSIAAAREAAAVAREEAWRPAVTVDGVQIDVAANIGSVEDAEAAVEAGADGVGLLRTEFLYLGRNSPPSFSEETAIYRRVIDVLAGRPLVLRTLDVGGDKPLPFLSDRTEENPFLGVRGIRLGLAEPEILSSQLQAALTAAAGTHLRLMFPMVAVLGDWRRARAMVDDALGRVETPPEILEVGVMVEVPSLALLADRFAEEVDFFSIGTNDLTQYTLAAERGNPELAGLADGLHPAVLSLIRTVTRAAEVQGPWVGVCGELGGDPEAIPILLGLGVRELSMNPVAIPRAKQLVRRIDLSDVQALADEVLGMEDAAQVRERAGRYLVELGG